MIFTIFFLDLYFFVFFFFFFLSFLYSLFICQDEDLKAKVVTREAASNCAKEPKTVSNRTKLAYGCHEIGLVSSFNL